MHPLQTVVATCSVELRSAEDVNPTFMPADTMSDVLRGLVVLRTQVDELYLRVLAAADVVANATGHRDQAAWLSHEVRMRRADAAADLRLARALDRDLPVLARAVREGRVNLSQARVIAAAIEELPTRVGSEVIEAAEVKLVELAAEHDPSALAKLGRRILEVVDPDRFEAEEARALAEAEKRADERQRLRIRALGDGTSRITGVVPDATAARLVTYLHAFTNPRRSNGDVRGNAADRDDADAPRFGERVSHPRRLAEAFTQLLEVIDPTRLPVHGGDATHVVVTIPYAALTSELGVAVIENETPGDGLTAVTAAQARRLACTAQIIPAILGQESEVLDLGRSARIFSRAQRRALALRDRTCRAEGCSVPGTWSEAHHLFLWARGGPTDLRNAALLCSRHHHRAHDPRYELERLAEGDVRFRRRSEPMTPWRTAA